MEDDPDTQRLDYYAGKRFYDNEHPATINISSFSYDSVFWINGHNLGPKADQLYMYIRQCWKHSFAEDGPGDDTECVQTDGYIYGVSTYLTLLFVFFEVTWVVGMFGVWWDANRHGELNGPGWRRNGDL